MEYIMNFFEMHHLLKDVELYPVDKKDHDWYQFQNIEHHHGSHLKGK